MRLISHQNQASYELITKTKECINVTVYYFQSCHNPSTDIVECAWRPLIDTKVLNIEIKSIEEDLYQRNSCEISHQF